MTWLPLSDSGCWKRRILAIYKRGAISVDVVDTTGAAAVSAIKVSRKGAAVAIPFAFEVDDFLQGLT